MEKQSLYGSILSENRPPLINKAVVQQRTGILPSFCWMSLS